MRRHSLVGPVVLILLGAIFLINNVRPNLNLFTLVATYWPFLLIGMGVLRLMEVLAYAAPICILSKGSGRKSLVSPCPIRWGTRTRAGCKKSGRL